VWVVLQIYAGHLADRYGRKNFIIIGLLIYGAFAFMCFRAQTFAQLLIFRMLQGVGLGLFGPASLGLVGSFEEKGRSFAIFRTAEAIGIIFAPILGGFVGDIGLSYPFLISMGAALLAIASLVLIKEERVKTKRESFFKSVKSMLKLKNFMYICIAAFIAELCFVSFEIVIPVVGESIALSAKKIGFVLSSYFVTFSLFQIPIGILSEKVSRKRLIVLSAFVTAVGFFLLFLSRTFWTMVSSMALLGVGLGAVFVQSSALVADIAPEDKKSLYLAFFDSIIDISFVVMPVMVGWILVVGERLPFILCTFLLIASAFVFLKFTKAKKIQSM
jgi:DHA1 family multidrug resistance protein-like MFS transporter